eukprot:g19493.t1
MGSRIYGKGCLIGWDTNGGDESLRVVISLQEMTGGQREITNDDELRRLLTTHRDQSELLDEKDITDELFSYPGDMCAQSLLRQAAEFLRLECRLDVQRPTTGAFDAHLVLGDKRIVGRCCIGNHYCSRVDIGLHERECRGGGRVRRCEADKCPDFLLGLVQDETVTGPGGRAYGLAGFYIFPRHYLQEIGALLQDSSVSPGSQGKTAVNVILPWMQPKRRGSQRKQAEQAKFFIGSGAGMDKMHAAEKARDIFAKYT